MLNNYSDCAKDATTLCIAVMTTRKTDIVHNAAAIARLEA